MTDQDLRVPKKETEKENKKMSETRKTVIDLLKAGLKIDKIVQQTGMHRASIYRIKKRFEAGEDVVHRKKAGGFLKMTEEKVADLKARVQGDPTRSFRKLAKDMSVSRRTVSKTVKNLGMTSYVRRPRQLLTSVAKEKRFSRSKKLLGRLRHASGAVRIYSDEKNWTVDQARNAQNDRYIAYTAKDVPPINRTKHPAAAMMLGVVSSDGQRMPPFWFPCGLKVGTKEYLEVMEGTVKPWLDEHYPEGNYIWQQDGAPGHTSNKTEKWCKDNLANFWEKTLWPPSSPNLNPLDYAI